MLLDDKPDGTKSKDEKYYLLSDVLPEDKELRSNLQQTRLENLLKIHQFEREDKNFERECLFCRHTAEDTRSNYLKHLFEKHNFHIARPENLILIDELIDTIANKLEKLQCIYCEKYFKDRTILKEHMRKKGHKRINPDNKVYDKFFLVNYLGEKQYKNYKKNSENVKKKSYTQESRVENSRSGYDSNVDSDPDWSEWTEDNGPMIMCLFCDHSEMDYDCILDHMERVHYFSFIEVTSGLDFYHKIKIVNFIRRQIHMKRCFNCDLKFEDVKNIEKHMRESKHFHLNKLKWDQPEYYFPTYEDDLFLSFIQDHDESWWSGDEKEREEVILTDNISKEMAMAVLEDA
ncbi:Zinc finger protein 277 [Eumeta japonica]|uniref:Zinc finger protein 277 n=1 Tax=Eumeta variegata TaxID=151549 RepID=A0A4C1WZZ2_EUMVA|nr:Zinc finger protein 277 [Eumeta japonica]